MHINTIFGYQFKNTQLIRLALHHPSLIKNNEFQRLEFLGDRIINMEVAFLIYAHYTQYTEGEMSILFSSLISGEAMNKIGRKHLLPCIQCNGQITKNIVADTLEAVMAALYLDGADVRSIIRDLWYPHILNREQMLTKHGQINNDNRQITTSNYKTLLNNIGGDNCKYQHIIKIKNNKNYFHSSVELFTFTGEGSGPSKREADEEAAKSLLDQLQNFSKVRQI